MPAFTLLRPLSLVSTSADNTEIDRDPQNSDFSFSYCCPVAETVQTLDWAPLVKSHCLRGLVRCPYIVDEIVQVEEAVLRIADLVGMVAEVLMKKVEEARLGTGSVMLVGSCVEDILMTAVLRMIQVGNGIEEVHRNLLVAANVAEAAEMDDLGQIVYTTVSKVCSLFATLVGRTRVVALPDLDPNLVVEEVEDQRVEAETAVDRRELAEECP